MELMLIFELATVELDMNSVSLTELFEQDNSLAVQRGHWGLTSLAPFSQCGRGVGGEGYRTQVEQMVD